jgi:hypothetical protein
VGVIRQIPPLSLPLPHHIDEHAAPPRREVAPVALREVGAVGVEGVGEVLDLERGAPAR